MSESDSPVVAAVVSSTAGPAVIADLARAYTDQFSSVYEGFRRRGEGLAASAPKDGDAVTAYYASDVEPVVKQKQAEITAIVTDVSEVPAMTATNVDTYKYVLETYGWVAICLFGAGLGGVVGGNLLSPIIEMFISNFMAVLLAYVALPYYFYQYNKSADASVTVDDKRMTLFFVALAMGVLNGHNLASCYSASFAPPSFIMPLTIAIVAELVGAKVAPARAPLLGACVGSAVVVHLVLGIASGSFGFGYLVSTLVQAAIGVAGLQYTLAAIKSGTADALEMQLAQVTAAIVLGAVGAYVTGMTKEQADVAYAYAQSQQ